MHTCTSKVPFAVSNSYYLCTWIRLKGSIPTQLMLFCLPSCISVTLIWTLRLSGRYKPIIYHVSVCIYIDIYRYIYLYIYIYIYVCVEFLLDLSIMYFCIYVCRVPVPVRSVRLDIHMAWCAIHEECILAAKGCFFSTIWYYVCTWFWMLLLQGKACLILNSI